LFISLDVIINIVLTFRHPYLIKGMRKYATYSNCKKEKKKKKSIYDISEKKKLSLCDVG